MNLPIGYLNYCGKALLALQVSHGHARDGCRHFPKKSGKIPDFCEQALQ